MGLRYLVLSKLLPTLLVGLDCLIIGRRPDFFWVGCGPWAAGLIWTARWWTLRWPLGMLWFLPLAARLNACPGQLAPILSGPLLSLVTLATVLTTIARKA